MDPTPLELCPTRELIEELVRRQTFLGVIVHAEEELKGDWNGERVFQVRFGPTLDAGEAGRLLDAVAEGMRGQ
jgi:hypothetical protein